VQDWAEGEPDHDDPTKNYPFPIPRIREIPYEFYNCTNVDASNLTISMSNPLDQNSNGLQNLEDATPDVVVSNDNNKVQMNSSNPFLSPHNSGSLPANCHFPVHISQPNQRHALSQIRHPTNDATCMHCGSRLVQSSKSSSDIKSTARQPSDDNQKDVARARSIIQYRNSILQE